MQAACMMQVFVCVCQRSLLIKWLGSFACAQIALVADAGSWEHSRSFTRTYHGAFVLAAAFVEAALGYYEEARAGARLVGVASAS